MYFQKILAASVIALGICSLPVFAGDITWSLNGTGTNGGILFSDGTEIDGTVTYDTTTNLFVSNTISTYYDGVGAATQLGGGVIPSLTSGSWFFNQNACCNGDPNGGGQLEMVDQNGGNLTNRHYFSLVPTNGVFDTSDSAGPGPIAYTFNEQFYDDNNPSGGNGALTYAGLCGVADCATSQAAFDPPGPSAFIQDGQGNATELGFANCPSCDSTHPSAWLSTVIAAAPETNPGSPDAPEPSTFVMLGSGLLLGGFGRRKYFASR